MPKKFLVMVFVVGLGILLLARCNAPEPEAAARGTRSVAAVDEGSEGLLAYEWHLEAFGKLGEEDEVLPETPIMLTFERQGTLFGSGGCNRYNTTFRTGPSGEISIRALARTQMQCAEETMYQERLYLEAFSEVTSFDVGADKLQLFYGKNEYAMVFRGEPRGGAEAGSE
jgi:heat shock protein HslJ